MNPSVVSLPLFWHFKLRIQEISTPISVELPYIKLPLRKRTPAIYFLTFSTCHAGHTFQLFHFNLPVSKPVENQTCRRADAFPRGLQRLMALKLHLTREVLQQTNLRAKKNLPA